MVPFAIILCMRRFRPFVPATIVSPAVAAGAALHPPSVKLKRAGYEAVCKRLTDGDNAFFGTSVVSELQSTRAAGGFGFPCWNAAHFHERDSQ